MKGRALSKRLSTVSQIGVEAVPRENRSPDFLQHFVEREVAKWAAAIKAAGLAP